MGCDEGKAIGFTIGLFVGTKVGGKGRFKDGFSDGFNEGSLDGTLVGVLVGYGGGVNSLVEIRSPKKAKGPMLKKYLKKQNKYIHAHKTIN